MTDTLDVLQHVWAELRSDLDGTWVGDVLPPAEQLDPRQVYVVVDELPGEEVAPWGGHAPLIADHVLDVDIHGPSRIATKAVRDQVKATLSDLPNRRHVPITRTRCPSTWHPRPDMNPKLKRVGAEFRFTART